MSKCECGSYAINPNLFPRTGEYLKLCDVCYFKTRLAETEQRLAAAEAKIPDKPLGVFSEGVWVFATTAQTFTAEDLDIAAFVKYRDYMKGGE